MRMLEVITLLSALLVVVGLTEIVAWVSLEKFFPRDEVVRQILLRNSKGQVVEDFNSIGQAYLLYIPAPGFSQGGILQHNEHGYRGPAIPLRRTRAKLRILFLGGSTTYGVGVGDPEKTYPAQLGQILEQQSLEGVSGVEVINAGLIWGTTAEIMTHYLFKYRYYRPDIVVVNTGANDAQATAQGANYHPDYSHWRQQLPELRALPPKVRWLMHSRTFALLAIRLFYSDVASGALFVRFDDSPPPAAWYTHAQTDPEKTGQIPEEDLAFKQNLTTIIREIKADGAEVLLVPTRLNPDPHSDGYWAEVPDEAARNERILKQLASEFEVDVAPFPAEVISPENWIDSVHLDEEGILEKANHVAESLLPIVRRLSVRNRDRR